MLVIGSWCLDPKESEDAAVMHLGLLPFLMVWTGSPVLQWETMWGGMDMAFAITVGFFHSGIIWGKKRFLMVWTGSCYSGRSFEMELIWCWPFYNGRMCEGTLSQYFGICTPPPPPQSNVGALWQPKQCCNSFKDIPLSNAWKTICQSSFFFHCECNANRKCIK